MVARPMKLPMMPASLFSAFDNVPLAACPVRARANLLAEWPPLPCCEGSKERIEPRSALPSHCPLAGMLMCVANIDIVPGPQTVNPEDVRQDDSGWTSTYY